VELPMTDVDGGDVGGPVGEQGLRETPGRRADVDGLGAAHALGEAEARERGLELAARSADRHARQSTASARR